MNAYETFKNLHEQPEALLLGNAWNAHSARQLEENGFKAIGTSSTALSYALGYDDGEGMSFAELLYTLKRIVASVRVPVSADIEFGYSTTVAGLLENIDKLHDAGIPTRPCREPRCDVREQAMDHRFVRQEGNSLPPGILQPFIVKFDVSSL